MKKAVAIFDSPLTLTLMTFVKETGLKFNALTKKTLYMDLNKNRLLLHTSFMFLPVSLDMSYCVKYNKINRLHKKFCCLIHNDKKFSFEELLEIDNSVSIHDRNLATCH